jgi:hypothetical protein
MAAVRAGGRRRHSMCVSPATQRGKESLLLGDERGPGPAVVDQQGGEMRVVA